jgi:hypothetical protein
MKRFSPADHPTPGYPTAPHTRTRSKVGKATGQNRLSSAVRSCDVVGCDRPGTAGRCGSTATWPRGNLLVRDGMLAAVIDFGTCGVGDPACDVAIAWTLLSGPSRDAFRARLAVDQETWARGRGWALWKALIVYAGTFRDEPAVAAEASRVIDEIVAEYATPAMER